MRVSLAFTGMIPTAATLPAIRAADRAGLAGVWHAEHIGFRDAFVPAAISLAETQRLEVGLVGLSAAGRHPAVTAMGLGSLAELGPGRIRAAIGTGDPGLVATLGGDVERPVERSERFLSALRSALGGAELRVEYPEYVFRGFRLAAAAPTVALDLMAVRPRMLRLAARVADGVSLSVGASRPYLRDAVALIETELKAAGRERSSFRIVALALGLIAEDLELARKPVLPLLASAEPRMAEHLARGVIEPGRLAEAKASRSPLGPLRIFTPDVIDAIALVATRDRIRDALETYAETGIDELAIALFADPAAQPELVERIAEVRPD